MNPDQLREKIRLIIRQIYGIQQKVDYKAVEYDELTKFPELKAVIVDLLTSDFDYFLASIDWVAPRPSTFRINLKNDQEFYLIWNGRSWIAQVEGKKYYLLNLPEEQNAIHAIARILRYGIPPSPEGEEEDMGGLEDIGGEETPEEAPEETPEETPET